MFLTYWVNIHRKRISLVGVTFATEKIMQYRYCHIIIWGCFMKKSTRKNYSTRKHIFRYKMCFLIELFFLVDLFFSY